MKHTLHLIAVSVLWPHALVSLGQTPEPMPAWYLGTGLPATDTDGDGIPDAWERRTFGDPAVADSGLDRDGDALADLEEFGFGSDPRTSSTMGDGWSDKEKRDAGLDSVFRVTPAPSSAQWLDWLGWSGQGWRTLTATNAEGFASLYAGFVHNTPPYAQEYGAADFWLVTRTDRPVWLTVGDALTTNSFPVRAGNSRVRIRAAYGGPVALTLDPHPGTLVQMPGATNGLWLCELSIEPVRPNTVLFSDGETPPPVPGTPDCVDGLLLLAPPPASAVHALASPPPGVTLQPLRMTAGAIVLGDGGWYCLPCGPGLCVWPDYGMAGCDAVSRGMCGLEEHTPILPEDEAWDIYWESQPRIECTVTRTVANATYPFIYGKVIFSFRLCEAVGGEIFGAEMNLPWHEPASYAYTGCDGIGCTCMGDGNSYVGFDHAKVHTRNLNHPQENPESDKLYHHCLGVIWDGQPINLADLCESCGLDLATLAVWEVNGVRQDSQMLLVSKKAPFNLTPDVYRVKMLQASSPDVVWDRLILVVNNPSTKTRFEEWYMRFSVEKAWLFELSAAYNSLVGPPTTNLWGKVSMGDPEPSTTNLWVNAVDEPGQYMHHTATWQMRSEKTTGGHGHQACYDTAGHIITDGVSAGTADYGENPTIFEYKVHVEEDVKPFIRALQMDGNPCMQSLTKLTHSLIYDGSSMVNYRLCRPSIPNTKPMLDPGIVP